MRPGLTMFLPYARPTTSELSKVDLPPGESVVGINPADKTNILAASKKFIDPQSIISRSLRFFPRTTE